MEKEKEEVLGENSAAGASEDQKSPVLQSEIDLSDSHEDDEHHDQDDAEHTDYTQLTKEQLLEEVKTVAKDDNLSAAERKFREIKIVFDELVEKDRRAALNRYILDGGNADGFEYRGDATDETFAFFEKAIRDRRHQQLKNREEQQNENLRLKQEILEKLREITDSQEVTNQFNAFKELQNNWRSIGAVPKSHARSLWANYHALVDRFYDNQSIYFELKELDRKKNLESKLELCVRAEKLSEVEKIKEAIRELNELHHEFKHIGPVPLEDKEAVWQRFKAASDSVYTRRDEFIKNLQQDLQSNLLQKETLCNEVEVLAVFQSDRIKDWNQKTKDILELQKKWETLGGVPRSKSKEINKKFWTAFKAFFGNKGIFFKKLDEERGENLEKKRKLVERALELKESSDWNKTTNEFKDLQQEWKTIGPVPEKIRQKIYLEFKAACDYFFEQRRSQQGVKAAEQSENLKAKEDICTLLEKHTAERTATEDVLKELETQFSEIGFVPKQKLNAIRDRYHKAVELFVSSIAGVSEEDKSKLILESQLLDLKNDPMADKKLYHKEQAIRKKINNLENDLAIWRNNLEFFARAKNGDKVRKEFNVKIDEASDHLEQLKQQLKLLQTVS